MHEHTARPTARKPWLNGPGPIIVLAVCGIAAMMLGVFTAAVDAGTGSSNGTGRTAVVDKGVNVKVISCVMSEHTATIGLEATNQGSRTRSVRVEVEYRDGAGRRVDTDTAYIRDIAPGDTASHEEVTWLDGAATGQGSCSVASVR